MKMTMESYDWDEIVRAIPYGMDELVNISVELYGYIHDTGIKVTICNAYPGHPANIAEAKKAFNLALNAVRDRWLYSDRFGYH